MENTVELSRKENAEQIDRLIGIASVAFFLFVILPEIVHAFIAWVRL